MMETTLVNGDDAGSEAAHDSGPAEDRRDRKYAPITTKHSLGFRPVAPLPLVLRRRIVIAIAIWYLSSFAVIFLNKYILSFQHVDPYFLTTVQMICMAVAGFVRLKLSHWWHSSAQNPQFSADNTFTDSARQYRTPTVFSSKTNVILGVLRVLTVLFGLVSLNYVAVSFTETVKSSAPVFTVLIAACLLGERTTLLSALTLLPIMLGLTLCSASELSFNALGFSAALLTNVAECAQFVVSKMFLSPAKPVDAESAGNKTSVEARPSRSYFAIASSVRASLSPLQLEYASAVAACAVQVPLFILFIVISNGGSADRAAHSGKFISVEEAVMLIDERSKKNDVTADTVSPPNLYFNRDVLLTSVFSGLCWHIQSLVSWELMSYVSPVTHAVINVVKRVLTIWLSVLLFGNIVTPGAWYGTALLVLGVLCYNSIKSREKL